MQICGYPPSPCSQTRTSSRAGPVTVSLTFGARLCLLVTLPAWASRSARPSPVSPPSQWCVCVSLSSSFGRVAACMFACVCPAFLGCIPGAQNPCGCSVHLLCSNQYVSFANCCLLVVCPVLTAWLREWPRVLTVWQVCCCRHWAGTPVRSLVAAEGRAERPHNHTTTSSLVTNAACKRTHTRA